MEKLTKKKTKDFTEVLNKAGNEDEMFQDNRPPFGADPFSPIEVIEKPSSFINAKQKSSYDQPSPSADEIIGQEADSMFAVHKKFTVTESMLELLNKECGFGEFISDVLRIAMEQVAAEAGSVFEVDYSANNIFFRSVAGKSSQGLLRVTVPMGAGIVGHVCKTQEPVATTHAEKNQMHMKSIGRVVGFEATNVIAVPIVIRGKTFGVLELLNRIGAPNFNKDDQEILMFVAECASKVIENRLILGAFAKELEAILNSKKIA